MVAGGGFVGVGGGPVVGVPWGTLGSATVAVGVGLLGSRGWPECVATSGFVLLRPASARTTATTPPITATRSANTTPQIQSPG